MAVVSPSDVLAVPKSVPLEVAATLTSGASTALRLLSDFSSLSSGDVVVQSGGESAVGEAVVQLAAKRGVKTVTFVKVRMGAVLLVGVVSLVEAVWSGRSVRADTCRWMMFHSEMRGWRLAGACPRFAIPSCGAWRHSFPPRASTRHPHCTWELQLTRECRIRIRLLWFPCDVFFFPPFVCLSCFVPQENAEYAATVERLKAAGGDVVVSEAYASSSGIREILADVGSPKLALNGTVRYLCSVLLFSGCGTTYAHERC